MEIARAIWNYYNLLSIAELNGLCDLADRYGCIYNSYALKEYHASGFASQRQRTIGRHLGSLAYVQ